MIPVTTGNASLFSCSAGVGRTGAFIVIDAMLESAKRKEVVDVFNYVQLIRANRISMVQTEVSLVNYLRTIKTSNLSKVSPLRPRIPSVIVTLRIYVLCS